MSLVARHSSLATFRPGLSLILLLFYALTATPEQLTIERIFDAPDLAGPSLRRIEITPDGSRILFLKPTRDEPGRFDLWEYDVEAKRSRLIVDSRVIGGQDETLSEEETARRERQRIASLSGIVDYQLAEDGTKLLIPSGGDLFLYNFSADPDQPLQQLIDTGEFETDARLSPDGRHVAFVRDQDLYLMDLGNRRVRRLTTDGGGVIRNGTAEFVAQEEMHRHTGYWWSPDSRRIAFTRVDETPVAIAERFEILADRIEVRSQRYPAAGTRNAIVGLEVVDLKTNVTRRMDLGEVADIYLARVTWFPDSVHLAVQRQSRDQKRIDLLRVDSRNGRASVLLTEHSDTWIEIHDDLVFLDQKEQFIWASDRTGYRHLYLYDYGGQLIQPLTAGAWMVVGERGEPGVLGVDEQTNRIYFMATRKGPLERQLYSVPITGDEPGELIELTKRQGWHRVELSVGAGLYVDTFSNPDTPPQVSLHTLDRRKLAYIEKNPLDETHPFYPFKGDHGGEEFGSIPAEDGQLLYYRLLRPIGFEPSRKYPTVVEVYGGPRGQRVTRSWMGSPRATGGYWRRILAQDGYLVFAIDNRGTGFRGEDFDSPLYGRLGEIELRDQVRGVEYLKSLPFVDPTRIGIFGWSYGGYMALIAMTRAGELFAAGVAGAPVTDWRLYDTHYTERYLDSPQRNPDGYRLSSVIAHADGLRGPLLIIHGMADDNVLFTHSTMLFETLQDQGTPFEVMVYPGAKHGVLRQPSKGTHAYRIIKRFFDRHLKP